MTPTSCSHCAAPLPAVPADHRHPDWCAACAARASGAVEPPPALPPSPPTGAGTWGGGSPAPTAPPVTGMGAMVTRTRLLDGALVGLAAAALAGVAWWAAAATTERFFVYAAILVGVIVGQGVLIGARRGGVLPGLAAAVLTLAALVVAQYFIDRSLTVSAGAEAVPLWLGLSTAYDVVKGGVEAEPINGLFWLLAAGVAALAAGSRSRRPVL